jgi:release factor glutamine methyltransferase
MAARTRRGALKEAVALMKAAALDTPVLDARLIVQHALGLDWSALFLAPDQDLGEGERARLEAALDRRAKGEPVSRIVGRRHFWTLDLAVSPDVLDPRADTETVIEAALAAVPDREAALRILDLGAGTGALLLALLAEYKQATGVGTDRAEAAVRLARTNADSHGLAGRADFLVADWADPLAAPFDLIVSNPPYISRGDLPGLPVEVRAHDPAIALDGGPDGLDAYRRIMPAIAKLLCPAGVAVVEIGAGQSDAVNRIAAAAGLTLTDRRSDLGKIERALTFRLKPFEA